MRRRELLCVAAPLSTAGCLRLIEPEDDAEREQTDGGSDPIDGTARQNQTAAEDADGNGGHDDDPDESSTEVDTGGSDENQEPDDVSYPRGLSDEGVSPLLTVTHVQQLRESSFVLDQVLANRSREWNPTTSVRVEDGTARVDGQIEWFYRDQFSEELWMMDYRGEELYGRPEYGSRPGDGNFEDVVREDELRAVLSAVSFTEIDVVERDGERLFRIAGDAADETDALDDEFAVSDPSDLSAEGYVDPDGIVRSFEAEFVAPFDYAEDDEDNLFEFAYEVGDLGETTVTTPEWVERAEEMAPELSLAAADDRTYLHLEHQGGQPLPAGVVINKNDEPVDARLDRELAEGEAVYFWIEDGEATLSRSSPPADARELEEGIVEVYFEGQGYFVARIRNL